ncbi:hypothetical protein AY601_0814 [Pedobacter cryoconitis]|uniref:Uncharacterized protein n=1 Tax=Pedobacter cryoconitis TaxID=188932 RepID=A0A127V8V8_9SPHI|nr:hypothetical protein [Pedobacter cryoconitis]AMP97756.1 hypothetical protein AY601_0814 [Pedobacter cryoconitis]
MKKILFIFTAVLCVTLFSRSAKAQGNYSIVLFEENYETTSDLYTSGTFGSGPTVRKDKNSYFNAGIGYRANLKKYKVYEFVTNSSSLNDRARSAKIYSDGPITFTVYDSPDAKTNDDYTVIRVKTAANGVYISSFENNYEDDNLKVTYYRKNGLDGKVSSLIITQ